MGMVVGYEGRRLSRMKDAALNDDSRRRMSQERVSPSPPGRHTGLAHPHSLGPSELAGAIVVRSGNQQAARGSVHCVCFACILPIMCVFRQAGSPTGSPTGAHFGFPCR